MTDFRPCLYMCKVYRCFVPKLARVSGTLNRKKRKVELTEWENFDDEEYFVFSDLKQYILSPQILNLLRSGFRIPWTLTLAIIRSVVA